MFYKQLLKITDVFDSDFIDDFDFWLGTLPENRTKNITASLVSSKFGISTASAKIILKILFEEKILEKHFIGKCPDCDMTIKIINEDELQEFLEKPQSFCSDCFEDVTLTIDDIFVAYRRIKKPDASEEEISKEILKRLNIEEVTENFNIADSLSENLFDLYEIFYNPDGSAYSELADLLVKLDDDYGADTTAKGNAYEDLVVKMFSFISGVNGTRKIRTYTNQFDCTVSCPYTIRIPTVFNYLTPYFVAECKNENSTASNTYFHKISNIMDGTEATVGMVFSRKHASKECHEIAYQDYLLTKRGDHKRILLSFKDEDLDILINKRKNLLKYLDFKILELTTNAKNAQFEMFENTDGKKLFAD